MGVDGKFYAYFTTILKSGGEKKLNVSLISGGSIEGM